MQLYETWKVAKLMSFTTILVSLKVTNWTAGTRNKNVFLQQISSILKGKEEAKFQVHMH